MSEQFEQEEYYTLEKREVTMEEELPSMNMPEEGQDLVVYEDDNQEEDSQGSSDSNREDNSDYDYPEEDEGSKSS